MKIPFVVLALLLGLGALMLHRMPVERYVVACERTTAVTCVLEQSRSAGTQRWQARLGASASAAAAAAAARLNRAFDGSEVGVARVEATPPPIFRRLAWGALAVTGLLVLAGYRDVRSRAQRPDEAPRPTGAREPS